MRRTLLAITAVLLATIGTTLLYIYVSTADNRAKAQIQTDKVLVATQDIGSGTSSAQLPVQLKDVARFDKVPGALSSTSSVQGKVLTMKVLAGQQLSAAMFGDVGTGGLQGGRHAISIQFGEAERVGAMVKAGVSVNVYQLGNNKATLVLEKAKVLSVQPNGLVTFDLSETEATRLITAEASGGKLVLDLISGTG